MWQTILIGIIGLPFISWGLTLFQCPDINTNWAATLSSLVIYLYSFNSILPIGEIMTLLSIVLGLEVAMWTLTLINSFQKMFSGRDILPEFVLKYNGGRSKQHTP